uniref:Uncharacterized protein n=1 Tax=Anguilla anguilla TaxID=7936 RepID=A0A0E9XRV1_ANGAN
MTSLKSLKLLWRFAIWKVGKCHPHLSH